jgi:hypothetical protein
MDVLNYFDIPSLEKQRELFPIVSYSFESCSDVKDTKVTDRSKRAGMLSQQYYTLNLRERTSDIFDLSQVVRIQKAVFKNTHGLLFDSLTQIIADKQTDVLKKYHADARVVTINSKLPYKVLGNDGKVALNGNGQERTSYNHTMLLFKNESLLTALSARVQQLEDAGLWLYQAGEQGPAGGDIKDLVSEALNAAVNGTT